MENADGIDPKIAERIRHPLTDPTAEALILGPDLNDDLAVANHMFPNGILKNEIKPIIKAYTKIVKGLPPGRLPLQAGDIISVGAVKNGPGQDKGGKGGHTALVEHFDRKFQVIYTIEGNQGNQMTGRAMELTKPVSTPLENAVCSCMWWAARG